MTDRLLTLRDLTAAGPRPEPGLYQLRVLERTLRRRVAEMDARVDGLLYLEGPPTDEEITEVDVLCAALSEVLELLDEVRHEAASHAARRRARRELPRRWA